MDADIGVEEDEVLSFGVGCASVPSAGWSSGPSSRRYPKLGRHKGFHGLRRAVINHQNVKIFIRGSREGYQALLQVVGAVIYRYDHRQSRTFAGVSWSQCWRLDGHYALVGRRHSVSLQAELYVIEDYGTFRVERLVLKSTVSPASQREGGHKIPFFLHSDGRTVDRHASDSHRHTPNPAHRPQHQCNSAPVQVEPFNLERNPASALKRCETEACHGSICIIANLAVLTGDGDAEMRRLNAVGAKYSMSTRRALRSQALQ